MIEFADDIICESRLVEDDDYDVIKATFHSGNDSIDSDFVKSRYNRKYVNYLVYNQDNNDIVAIYSLSCSACMYSVYNKIYTIPAVEVPYFAVNLQYQNIKYREGDGCISSTVLYDLMGFIFDMSENIIGATKIILYATPNAVSFYEKCGFTRLDENMLQNQDRYLEGCTLMYTNIC